MTYSKTAWPYIEAAKIPEYSDKPIVFETGFGPSGLPHLGTFAEVYRTTLVRRAYEDIMGYHPNTNTKLIVFSDDKDALRKVPDNIPNQSMLNSYIGYSLSSVPDPYGKLDSFAAHNNSMLKLFLDRFGFEYHFASSSEYYKSKKFGDTLSLFQTADQHIKDIIIPTLGDDRAKNYSPFMPIVHGQVIEAEVVYHNTNDKTFAYIDPETNETKISSILDGECKLQWKADWAMRWIALGVDYEMAGKDLTESVELSGKIATSLGYTPPNGFIYEMFLDANGQKISKSKGNGITVDEWLRYGSEESLTSFLFHSPTVAKKIAVDIIPNATDSFSECCKKYYSQTEKLRQGNPAHYLKMDEDNISYNILLNLAKTLRPSSFDIFIDYVSLKFGEISPSFKNKISLAYAYYVDNSKTLKKYEFDETASNAINDLYSVIESMEEITADDVQKETFTIGKKYYTKKELREWFKQLYRKTLNQDNGPPFGTLAELLGKEKTLEILSND